MSPRKSVQHELTREMIMDAARDLFVKNGYGHVSMRQIAKELNYSHGAIYYHFQNKAELFYALVEDHFGLLEKKLDEIMLEDLAQVEKLKKIFLGYIQFGLTYQSHYEIMFLIKEEELLSRVGQGPNKTYEKFAQSVKSLCGSNITIQEIWSTFLSLHGFVTHYIGYVNDFKEVEGLAHSHANFLLNGLRV